MIFKKLNLIVYYLSPNHSKYYLVLKTSCMKPKTFAVDIDGTITENGVGRINLDALFALRHLTNIGHNVIFVTGRSSVEAYLLSVFGGTTKIAVGENGGCITVDTNKQVIPSLLSDQARATSLPFPCR
jgi:hydroxymethylpyrimidine pyrophosphatase-like HAD family hydrolase